MRLAGFWGPAGFGVQLGQPGPKCLSGVGMLGRIRVPKMGAQRRDGDIAVASLLDLWLWVCSVKAAAPQHRCASPSPPWSP